MAEPLTDAIFGISVIFELILMVKRDFGTSSTTEAFATLMVATLSAAVPVITGPLVTVTLTLIVTAGPKPVTAKSPLIFTDQLWSAVFKPNPPPGLLRETIAPIGIEIFALKFADTEMPFGSL